MRSMPILIRYSQAAPMPIAWAMGGVPASKRAGMSANVVFSASKLTSLIISPPPFQGGMPSNTSRLAHRKPTPVGPYILWPEATKKSTPRDATSNFKCGADWQASNKTSAPTRCATSTMALTGLMHPKVFEMCVTATNFVRGVSKDLKCCKSSSPVDPKRTYFTTAPQRLASNCHGTMFEWCSIAVVMISSPNSMFAMPQLCATKLIASVAPLVKTTSSGRAPMNLAMLLRASSYSSVAFAAIA
mmetsp:Transcript_30840/g.88665  ORF Transcript_30840/g.88665 Transcript_30840/m.88665 type:complete len:244 (-) Transcript_30840:641-1372(-)